MKELKWFAENYIESKEECKELLIKAQIDYPFTIAELKEGCMELQKTSISNPSLIPHIKLIGDLCSIGVQAEIAGESIRKAILKMKNKNEL